MPEQHDLSLGDRLGPLEHELDYIVEISTQSMVNMSTYLLLCDTFLGLMSSALNHAK